MIDLEPGTYFVDVLDYDDSCITTSRLFISDMDLGSTVSLDIPFSYTPSSTIEAVFDAYCENGWNNDSFFVELRDLDLRESSFLGRVSECPISIDLSEGNYRVRILDSDYNEIVSDHFSVSPSEYGDTRCFDMPFSYYQSDFTPPDANITINTFCSNGFDDGLFELRIFECGSASFFNMGSVSECPMSVDLSAGDYEVHIISPDNVLICVYSFSVTEEDLGQAYTISFDFTWNPL